MSWFRRASPSRPSDEAIAGFWRWWTERGRAKVDAALMANEPQRVVDDLAVRVRAIHDDLSWELAAGHDSRSLLVVSAEGDPELRAIARRWLRSAPPADEQWTYADLKQPVADVDAVELSVNGASVRLADVQITARVAGHRIDVSVHHPALSEMSEDSRVMLAFLALDSAIGERDVELWLGAIAPAVSAPQDTFPLRHLRGLVADHAGRLTDEDGNFGWVVLNGEGPEGEVIAATQTPLVSVTAPDLDEHVSLDVPYTEQTASGLPGAGAMNALRQLEDHLCERLGNDGRLVAHETSAGRRIMHFYVDSTGPGVSVLRASIKGWEQGAIAVMSEPDAGWTAVDHLRV